MNDTNFDRALALGFIGAGPNGSPETRDAGQARPTGEDGVDRSEPGRRGGDAESAPLYLPSIDVRAVRRDTRKAPTGEDLPVVVVEFVATDESIDSHRTVVVCDHDLDRYEKNPVLLWAHNRDKDHLPIGRCESLKISKGKNGREMTAVAVFFMRTDFQRDIAEAYARGECRMFSIGFYPNKFELRDVDGEEILYLSGNQLVEISAIPVGSNENALSKKALDAVRIRARAAKTPPAPPDPPQQRATAPVKPGAPKDQTMNTLTIDGRAIRADKAASRKASCPNCKEDMMVEVAHLPMPDEKAIADLTARATTAESKVAETIRALDLAKTELDGAKQRLAAMEPELTAALQAAKKHQAERIAAAIEERSGKKIFPTEKASEVRIAGLLLADSTPDPDKAGSTLGEKAWAARLAEIDARPDIGLLGGPVTGPDQKQQSGAGHTTESRSIAVQIDEILAKQSGSAPLPS